MVVLFQSEEIIYDNELELSIENVSIEKDVYNRFQILKNEEEVYIKQICYNFDTKVFSCIPFENQFNKGDRIIMKIILSE